MCLPKKFKNARATIARFRLTTAGSLGGERESIKAVQLDTQALTLSSTGPVLNFVPETKILDVAFLFCDGAHARAVPGGPIGQALLKDSMPKASRRWLGLKTPSAT